MQVASFLTRGWCEMTLPDDIGQAVGWLRDNVPGGTPAANPRAELIYLGPGEAEALMMDTLNNSRVVQCAFGPGAVWLDPDTRDEVGLYPRWILLRLAVLRGRDLTGMALTNMELAELTAFAHANGKRETW